MRTEVKKWGNSAVVRIPKLLLEECHLSVESPVEMRVEDGRIIVEPIKTTEYNLDDLLAGVTKNNLHEEIDFGKPVGKEAL
ncbi:MAG: AbrB/MazE/SpoVT family DNA-binding domain-containing protein [Methylothermaceae bacterium]|nr:AbrB/MazE/SpoVT family DNA-binding domain-containing protein [Methylothermaceae bacterium]